MMERLIAELVLLASDPRAWFAVAGLGLIALHSLYIYLRCPLVHGTLRVTPEEARRAVHAERVHSTRYLLLMLTGIGLCLAGMAMVALSARTPLALGLVAAGLFLVQTEPLRLNIRDRQLRVVAAQIEGESAVAAAVWRLRGEYRKLILTTSVLTLALAAYLVAL